MLRLFLVRHGETVWNRERRLQGHTDSRLTRNGVENTEKLHEILKQIDFKKIYTSPLQRAVRTAEIIKGDRDLEIIPDKRLKEINLGEWEGMTIYETEEQHPAEYRNFWNDPQHFTPFEGERPLEVQTRVDKAVEDIVESNKDGNILIVSHGYALKLFLTKLENKPLSELWNPPILDGSSLSVVEYSGDEVRVILYGKKPEEISSDLFDN